MKLHKSQGVCKPMYAHTHAKSVCVCVCVCGEKGGALNRGPSSPDLKRHSFIIANLPNINMRASTQSLSQGRGGDPPMTGDEGPHERRTVHAPGRPTVCVTESCTGCINQSRYQFYNSCLWTDLYFFLFCGRVRRKKIEECVRACVCLSLRRMCVFLCCWVNRAPNVGRDSTCETVSSATTDN